MAQKLKLNRDKETTPSIIKGLNRQQIKAVEAVGGPLLIIAGAGSGKTRVLTHRIANILDRGVEPYRILALTFTNKAAGELKERIAKLVGYDTAREVWAGTFHSIFARILRIEGKKLGYSPGFSIYDTDDQSSAIRSILNRLRLTTQEYPPNQVRSSISKAKNAMVDFEAYADKANTHFEKTVAEIYKEYERYLLEANAMDFDDLLINMIRLFELDKESLEKYRNKFQYIMIDEYQDTNRAQYKVIKLLSAAHNNICVVGDDAQSIYKWRGADIRNILEFQKDYPSAKIIKLEQNYRSTGNILKAADSIIAKNKNQLKKELWTEKEDGDKIKVVNCEDDRQEALKIATLINQKNDSGKKYRDMAILYRTNAQSLPLENALRRENIPYVIVGGISFYKRKEIKDTMAYLKLLINPQDNESLLRAVNEPPRGIGKTSIGHFIDFSRKHNTPLLDTFRRSEEVLSVVGRAKKSARRLWEVIEDTSNLIKKENPSLVLKDYIDKIGILDMYKDIGTDEALDKYNNIQELVTDLTNFFDTNPQAELNDYIQQISLASDIDNSDLSGNSVSLMTLHSAKGLEFPEVFITGLEQGLFPSSRSENEPSELEEERRLFYVGITRAMQSLTITYCSRRMKFGDIQRQSVSTFLKEIDHSVTQWMGGQPPMSSSKKTSLSGTPISTGSDILGSWRSKVTQSPGKRKSHYDQTRDDNYSQVHDSLRTGDRVVHSKFGEGKLLEISGNGDQQKVTVKFDEHGKKIMIAKFAKLSKV
jgi:DNA helicase-2/ATP-dependent DNA helicase PcrA